MAYGGTRLLLALVFPGAQSIPIHASPSLAVLGFACGLSLLTGVLFGAAPAWIAARAQPVEALRSGMRTAAGRATLLQRGVVVVQAALSLVLLVGAGLFARSLDRLQSTDLKLDSQNRFIVHINPQAAGYSQRQVEISIGRSNSGSTRSLPWKKWALAPIRRWRTTTMGGASRYRDSQI